MNKRSMFSEGSKFRSKMLHSGFLLTFFSLLNLYAYDDNAVEVVPLFHSCSIYFYTNDLSKECTTWFREKDSSQWQNAFPLIKNPEKVVTPYEVDTETFPDKSMFRGSIVNLKENTEYELKIKYGNTTYTKEFKTWNSDVPIKKTVNLQETISGKEIIINEKGTKDGWIKYTAPKGSVLKNQDGKYVILVANSDYIILEGLTVEGGKNAGIFLMDSSNIRIVNCDISNWGRKGEQDFFNGGKYYSDGKALGNDCGIRIYKSGKVLIERCYIHDPVSKTNSWEHGHPTGSEAVNISWSKGEIVLRYNDFIGSDLHRWNDAVSSSPNGSPRGGFYRDAEINGNMFIFANDDGIEIEGGEMNIKVFLNKFEGVLSGISTAPCWLGPSYIYKNLICNLGDEDGIPNPGLKNGYGGFARGRIYAFNNTLYCNKSLYAYGSYNNSKEALKLYGKELKGYTRNNIFYALNECFNDVFRRNNDFDYDLIYNDNPEKIKIEEEKLHNMGLELHGIFGKNPDFIDPINGDFRLKKNSPAMGAGIHIDNFAEKIKDKSPDLGAMETEKEMALPYRPIPVYLDKYQVNFKFNQGENVPCLDIGVHVKGTGKYSEDFIIKKNTVFDWFTVAPSEGTFKENGKLDFKVSIVKEKIKKPGLYRGAFLIRQENGYSRPVTVYADVGGLENIKKRGKAFTVYMEAETPSSSLPFKIIEDEKASEGKSVFLDCALHNQMASYDFEVPKDAAYFILLRTKTRESWPAIYFSLDDEKQSRITFRGSQNWKWSKLKGTNISEYLTLKKGKHRIKISPAKAKSIYFDLLLVTDDYNVTLER